MRIALLSIYEMGRQPFGLASPAAWLRAAGHEVTPIDLSRDEFPSHTIENAEGIALYISMHTAMRLSLKIIERVRSANPIAGICCYGLYPPLNEQILYDAGVDTILGGEFERALVDWAAGEVVGGTSTEKLSFLVPDRVGLPSLDRYARVLDSVGAKIAGYTEASRGCKHLCRHCPIVPVYSGAFRVIARPVVLEDIRRQVEAGAQHITFGDPDFFNGVGHARQIVEEVHRQFPGLTYDVTIKVEHLLKHQEELERLKRTGCLFVTSAVESIDDEVLGKFAKGHIRADFFTAVRLMRAVDLHLSPTFVTFTPWTTREKYRELLQTLVELDLVASISPIQLAIRLLIPAGSRLLELPEVRTLAGPFDREALAHQWRHQDPEMDELCASLQKMIARCQKEGQSRTEIFRQIWQTVNAGPLDLTLPARATVPYLEEPWYC